MIGEMRDTETAQIAVQSALTGHLVLSTLHTNTAAGAITRLEDMGGNALITAAVNGVLSQRLIRRLCDHCKRSRSHPRWLKKLAWLRFVMRSQPAFTRASAAITASNRLQRTPRDPRTFHFGQHGAASGSGRGGCRSAYESARQRGMRTLYEDGLMKVAAGLSSLDEVLRITQDQTTDRAIPSMSKDLCGNDLAERE